MPPPSFRLTNIIDTAPDRQGTQGVLDTASKGTLESEFGTSKEDDVIAKIIEKGDVQESEVIATTRFPGSVCVDRLTAS